MGWHTQKPSPHVEYGLRGTHCPSRGSTGTWQSGQTIPCAPRHRSSRITPLWHFSQVIAHSLPVDAENAPFKQLSIDFGVPARIVRPSLACDNVSCKTGRWLGAMS